MEISGQKISAKAIELGFKQCGFARAEPLDKDREFFLTYLKERRNAGLQFLERKPEIRIDPRMLMPGTQTVIGLLVNYFPHEIIPETDNLIISKHAYGKDYHNVMKERTRALINFMKDEFGPIKAKSFIDSGPVLEKAWARECGLGWTGKNTLLINPQTGSFHFIAIILTDLLIEPDFPEIDHCMNCRACLDACPTGALEKAYELNPSKCISYLTIEDQSGTPDELKEKLHGRIYGCDICQDGCPYNRFAVPHSIEDFKPDQQLMSFRKQDWLHLTRDQFETIFKDSSIYRIGYDKLMRNIVNAANSRN